MNQTDTSFAMAGIDLLAEPEFPPLINGVAVAGNKSAMQAAFEQAETGNAGAGDLYWSRKAESLDCAIVLEPEISAASALVMVPLAMVAAADSLGAIGPPNLAITFLWPGTILANGAVVGQVDMRFPDHAVPSDIPEFACLSLSLDIHWAGEAPQDPGQDLRHTVLHEEGCGDLDRTMILESWARHFLTWMDTWTADGFKPVHESWLFRAHDRNEVTRIELGKEIVEGELIGMDEMGGILIKQDGNTRLVELAECWFPQKGGKGA